VLAVAAAEAAVAIAIIIALFRLTGGINVDDATALKH
jgi:NADH:ubiquinone oxidoreductase subunit K